jgi:tripartite-type tricarboxylate transporter receptor subunit TctC
MGPTNLNRIHRLVLAPLFAIVVAFPASAQPYPSKAIEFVVHTAPGGGTDLFARVVTDILQKEKIVSQPLLVANRTGGGGAVAFSHIKTRRGDPYTVLTVATGSLLTNAARTDMGLGLENYTPLAFFAVDPQAIMVSAESKFATFKDLIEAARKQPDTIICAVTSPGGSGRLALYMLEKATGAKFKFVAFKGGGDAVLAVLGGHVQFTTENVSEAFASIEAKTIRVLGMTTAKRLPQMPNIPTLTELGTTVQVGTGRGFAMPAGVPKENAAFMESALEKAHRSKAWQDFSYKNVFEDRWLNSAQFAAYLTQRQAEMQEFLQSVGLGAKP